VLIKNQDSKHKLICTYHDRKG